MIDGFNLDVLYRNDNVIIMVEFNDIDRYQGDA